MGVQPQLLGGTERADGLEAGRTILAAGRTFGLAADRPVPATLILGMGNPILSDDAVGLRLAAELRGRLRDRPDLVRVEDCMVGGLSLLDLLAGFDRLIVLDSIKTAGGTAGMWYRFSGSCLQETMNLSNVHDANFATALELGRRMGMHLPDSDDIHVFAVEVADNLTFSEDLTPDLQDAFPELVDEIFAEVHELLDATSAPTNKHGDTA